MSYTNAFISVAPDTKARAGTVPPKRGEPPSVAYLEYELMSSAPYGLTQEEIQFAVHVQRSRIPTDELEARREVLWSEFFSRPMACLRASPLPKTYGWGLHFDAAGKVALVGCETEEYQRLSGDVSLTQVTAMKSRRS